LYCSFGKESVFLKIKRWTVKPQEPAPVKLVIAILYSDQTLLEKALSMLSSRYGPIDYQSPIFPFDHTDYYVAEMGSPILRLFISHEPLIHPKDIARIKIETNEIEEALGIRENEILSRKVNLDPGYMDYDKVVLASTKYNGQKIYLDFGIWADLTLRYEKDQFYPYPWSFPDFKTGMYNEVFLQIRKLYKIQRKSQK